MSEDHHQLSEGGRYGFPHFSYRSTLHLTTDTVFTEELASPGFGMETDVRGLVPLSYTYPNV